MNLIRKILEHITKSKKCCKNCRFWNMSQNFLHSPSAGNCKKTDENSFTYDNYLCGKFEYCTQLLQTAPGLRVIKFDNKQEKCDDNN